MKTRTFQLLLLASVLLASFEGWTQNAEVHFAYDACGNRILKSIQLRKINENGINVEDRNALFTSATDYIQKIEIGIYPNPTKGGFTVTLSDHTIAPLEATLTTAMGAIIEHHRFDDVKHEFDLTSQPVGVYILELVLANETHTWKIVKQ